MTDPLTTDHRAPHLIQVRFSDEYVKKYGGVSEWETKQEWPTWRICIIKLANVLRGDNPKYLEFRIIQKSLLEN